MLPMKRLLTLLCSAGLLTAATPGHAAPAGAADLNRIQHIVVIMLENHSFDSLYGRFPGAEGSADADPEVSMQSDLDGRLYETLPPVMRADKDGKAVADSRFPPNLPNDPFDIAAYVPADQKMSDLPHRFFLHQQQIDGGRMDHFVALSGVGALPMGYYDAGKLPLGRYAARYTLADHFFQAAFGGSFLNHQWLICGCTPKFSDAPKDMVTELDRDGKITVERAVTPDGYAVNTVQPYAPPYDPKAGDAKKRLPAQLQSTIGDRLSEKNVRWAWYSGGWNNAVAGHADATFQYHHQPFAYYHNYGPGSKGRAEHLKDATELLRDIDQGKLPAVAFYKPIGALNEHPGYADVLSGEQHVADLVAKIEQSPLWKDSVIIVTYDEYGGFWDHVPPPRVDDFGPGTRVPTLVISPFAKRGFVDHTVYDTTSILKLIELRHGLKPLGARDEAADGMLNAFEFNP
ncbi:MAG: acid phosphatase [Methylococcaceae bacterium]|nr:MAG: acid phosphatase [Methylococcaceae bacterium]